MRESVLPADIVSRLKTLGGVLAESCDAIDFAYLFGSASTGRLGPRSDVDVAIHVSPAADPHTARLEAARAATTHLGTEAVDLVLLNTAPLALAGRVLTTRQVILDRQPFQRHLYESIVARMFQDFRIREHRLLAERYSRG